MRLTRYFGMICVVFVAVITCSAARAVECSREDADAAASSVDNLDSWKAIYSAYKRFKQCDDGGIAEGFSDSAAKIMANHWSSLPKALPFIQADPAFEAWFIGHLDETDTNDDLLKIDHLSRTACPKRALALCEKIHARMKEFQCPPDFPKSVGCKAKIDRP